MANSAAPILSKPRERTGEVDLADAHLAACMLDPGVGGDGVCPGFYAINDRVWQALPVSRAKQVFAWPEPLFFRAQTNLARGRKVGVREHSGEVTGRDAIRADLA